MKKFLLLAVLTTSCSRWVPHLGGPLPSSVPPYGSTIDSTLYRVKDAYFDTGCRCWTTILVRRPSESEPE